MKFSILGFNQILLTSIVGYTQDAKGKMKELRLDMNDLIIIKEIADFMNRKKIIKYTIDDKTYFSIQYQSIIEDLPILRIKKQALADRIDKLVFLNIIEKKVVKTQIGSFTAFRLTDIYEELQYGSTSSKLLLQKYQTTSAQVVDYEPKYNTTNTSITNTNKEDTKKDELFEECWKLYRRKGAKGKAKIQWDKLNDSEKSMAKSHIPAYVSSCSEIKFQKDFERYLRDKIFNNVVYRGNATIFDPEQLKNQDDYRPKLDGHNMIWIEAQKCYMTPFDFSMLNDGYNSENRPSSAIVMYNGWKYKWNVETHKWDKL